LSGRYLLDTHVFIDVSKGRRLSPRLRQVLGDSRSRLFLSVVSIAEVCIKASLGKLALPQAIAADPVAGFDSAARQAGYAILPVELAHAAMIHDLPVHHRDPFDRLLICQAISENLILISDDNAFPLYSGLALFRP
jgi:PIN domain nuclease of toxin-antitoxin system